MNEHAISSPSQVTIYNPNEIINLFSESLSRRGPGIVNVRGIYHRGKGGNYGGYFYDSLKDEFSPYEMSIKIPEGLRSGLEDGNLVEMRGTVDRKVNNYCTVQLQLNVTGVAVVQEQTISEGDLRRIEIRKKKASSGYRKVDNILESAIFADRRPSVALVFADSSITDADCDAGKEAAAVQIDFREYRVSFARPEAFIATLRQADSDGHDVICVVRGGGSGLEALENLDVLDCIAGMEAAVVTAVGHAADKVFINEIADLEIGTPSLLGSYFKDMVEKVAKKKADSTAALTKKIEAQFKEQIDTARKQNAELQKKFDELSKNSAEATKKHDEQVKAAQEQNRALQEKITKMTESARETQKINKEQNDSLQAQLKIITEANRKQGDALTRKIGEMQGNITSLTEKNAQINRELSEAVSRNSSLQAELAQAKANGGSKVLTIILAVISVVLLIALLLK